MVGSHESSAKPILVAVGAYCCVVSPGVGVGKPCKHRCTTFFFLQQKVVLKTSARCALGRHVSRGVAWENLGSAQLVTDRQQGSQISAFVTPSALEYMGGVEFFRDEVHQVRASDGLWSDLDIF